MKQLLITALMVLMSTGAQAQKEVFDKYEDTKGVSTVFISKALLNLAGGFASIGDKKLGKMAGKMDNVRIMNCENKSLIAKIKRDAQAIYNRDEYEEMMRINEDGQRVVIYQRILKSGKNEFALFSVEDDELSIINITGTITLEDMKQFTKD
ncbi:MAG: DUF4252 domain-containing protein [Bacteroidaceae bacterium]|nr:DUF4252 domain-containing protein [Bacteroidaceae bacterium]MBR1789563.1 DUF4252 domain-containing protein [Bacteroidaceae bacterium]